MTKNWIGALAALGLALAGAAPAQEKKGAATAEVVRVAVARKLDPAGYPGAEEGTRVEVLASVPGRHLLRVDQSGKVTAFADDKGTSLLDTRFRTAFTTFTRFARDRESVLVSVVSRDRVPAKGASKLTLKGSLVLVAGGDERTTAETRLGLKDRQEAKVDGMTLRVTRAGGRGAAEVEIGGAKVGIRKVSVKDAGGKELPFPGLGSSSVFGKPGRVYSFRLESPPEECRVRITYFGKEEKITIPVDLAVGPGL